jgi:AAA domain
MKLSISGTYSSGKTIAVLALSSYTAIPHTLAPTMREIMPEAVPGKALWECTPAEYLQLAMRRHVGRSVHEALLPDGFISDGSSLQEWIYGEARLIHGMDPGSTVEATASTELSDEMRFFGAVIAQFGHAFRQHVKTSFDAFVHLRNEIGLVSDGHRPLNDRFRATCDEMLLNTLEQLRIPHHVVGGDLPTRLHTICELLGFEPVMDVDEAIGLAQRQYEQRDMRFETERAPARVMS